MIFVTIGVMKPFPRLIKKVDALAPEINREVVVQYGEGDYAPGNCEAFKFCDRKQHKAYLEKADLIVSHAGTGTVIRCIAAQSRVVLVPRRKKYNEHRSDHQFVSAKTWHRIADISFVEDVSELDSILAEPESVEPPTISQSNLESLTRAITDDIEAHV